MKYLSPKALIWARVRLSPNKPELVIDEVTSPWDGDSGFDPDEVIDSWDEVFELVSARGTAACRQQE